MDVVQSLQRRLDQDLKERSETVLNVQEYFTGITQSLSPESFHRLFAYRAVDIAAMVQGLQPCRGTEPLALSLGAKDRMLREYPVSVLHLLLGLSSFHSLHAEICRLGTDHHSGNEELERVAAQHSDWMRHRGSLQSNM